MNSKRGLLGIVGVIVAAVVVYFGFFYPQPADEDLQATIGTVEKHQSEQISDEDVVLAGEETSDWSDDPIVVEAMASILERATIAQRSFAYLAVGRQAKAKLLMGASAETKSAILGKVAHGEQVEGFNRVEKGEKEGLFERMKVKEADFGAMSLEKKVGALQSLGAKDRAQILARVSRKAQLGAVAKADPQHHADILGRASRHDLARVYMAAPELNRVNMFNSLDLNSRQALMGKVYTGSGNNLLHRATPVEMENLRNQMSEKNAADLFGKCSVHDQLAWAGRAVKTDPSGFGAFGRASNRECFGRLFLHATSQQKVAFFRAHDADVQKELLGKMAISQKNWEDMDLNAKAKALSDLSLERRASLMDRASKATVVDLARSADVALQKQFVGGLSRVEMARAIKMGASSREVHQALGRQPEIRNAVFEETPPAVQVRIMGRMVRNEVPIQ